MRILVDETGGSEGGSQTTRDPKGSQVGEIRPRKPGPSAFDQHFQARPESSLARYTVSVFLLSLAKEPGPRDWCCP